MRLSVVHEIAVAYDPAPAHAVREIRMTPRTYDGQFVGDWRIDVDRDCRLDRDFDAFGNAVHDFTVTGPFSSLTVTAAGTVEVDDTNGVLQAGIDRLPPAVFLRETPLTTPGAAIHALTGQAAAAGAGALDRCHGLMGLIAEGLEAEPSGLEALTGTVARTAEAVAVAGRGDATGIAHVFVAAARLMGIPARFTTGYLWRDDDRDAGEATHAWAEAHVAGLGWVGFDAVENRCPTDAYIRVAVGLDQHGAAFLRGADLGSGTGRPTARALIRRIGP